jgi:hypothetical protein
LSLAPHSDLIDRQARSRGSGERMGMWVWVWVLIDWFRFSMSSNFHRLDSHNVMNLVFHWQIYDEASAKFNLRIGPHLM